MSFGNRARRTSFMRSPSGGPEFSNCFIAPTFVLPTAATITARDIFTCEHVRSLAAPNARAPIYVYRSWRMSFGALISSLPIGQEL